MPEVEKVAIELYESRKVREWASSAGENHWDYFEKTLNKFTDKLRDKERFFGFGPYADLILVCLALHQRKTLMCKLYGRSVNHWEKELDEFDTFMKEYIHQKKLKEIWSLDKCINELKNLSGDPRPLRRPTEMIIKKLLEAMKHQKTGEVE